jgi:hypothetical protein
VARRDGYPILKSSSTTVPKHLALSNDAVLPILIHAGDPSRESHDAAKLLDWSLGPARTAGEDTLSATLVVIEKLETLWNRRPFSGRQQHLRLSPNDASPITARLLPRMRRIRFETRSLDPV